MAGPAPEYLAEQLQRMDRRRLVRTLQGLHCPFDLDFTEDFLRTVSLSRLRHIILAASLHAESGGFHAGSAGS